MYILILYIVEIFFMFEVLGIYFEIYVVIIIKFF